MVRVLQGLSYMYTNSMYKSYEDRPEEMQYFPFIDTQILLYIIVFPKFLCSDF
jgi:hypothetical protein